MKQLLSTYDSLSLFIIRIVLGFVMLPHGLQKTFGCFGGHGFGATMSMFTEKMHLPYIIALLVIAAEFLGAIGLIVGCLTRVAALGILAVMVGAIATVHGKNGFFASANGYEYHLLMIGMALALIIGGAGKWSIDRCLSTKSSD